MSKRKVESPAAPAAVGPYSQAIESGQLFFLSGQLGLDPASGKLVDGGIERHVEQIFKNIKAVLKAADLSLANVIKTTIFLTKMEKELKHLVFLLVFLL